MIRFRVISLLLFLVVSSAAKEELRFKRWSTDNGLPHNTVRKIVQTPNGYLWITTLDGLARFDGVRFTTFNSINTKEISDNRFYDIIVEDDGTVWASMLNGSIVRYRRGEFKSFKIAETESRNVLIIFYKTKAKSLLINVYKLGEETRYFFDDGKLTLAPKEFQIPAAPPFHSSSGKTWKADRDGITEATNGKTTHYPISLEIRGQGETPFGFEQFEDRSGALWIGNRRNLHKFSGGEIQTIEVAPENSLVKEHIIIPKFEDEEGKIWFVHIEDNLSMVKTFKDGDIEVLKENGNPLRIDRFFAFKDRENQTWLGSGQGLRLVKNSFIKSYSAKDGLSGKTVYPILQRKSGEIIISTDGAVDSYNKGEFKKLFDNKFFRSFAEDSDGRLWVGMNKTITADGAKSGNLIVYDGTKIKDLSHLVDGDVDVIKADRLNNIWLGGEFGLLKIRDDRLIQRFTVADGLKSNGIKYIHDAGNGVLWLGTTNGIARFEDGKFQTYTTENGLPANRIRTIYEDSDKTLWIGTYGSGLSRFKNGEFFNYTSEDGLYHNGVFQIFEDDNENFWIGGNQGIYRVAKKELNDFADGKIKTINTFGYGKEDGMLNVEVNGGRQPAGIKASDGRLWFPTMDGVAIVDPKAIGQNRNVPNPLIEEVRIERQRIEFENGIVVGVGKDDLEIKYTAPSFTKPSQIKFKYKLDGFNVDWVHAGTRRTAYYSSLPPGNYMFRLQVSNSDGIWNEKEANLQIRVLAPFYRTSWFYALVILSIIGVGVLFYRYRFNQLEKRNAEQMAFSQKLISTQEAERKRIAAGLHDSLGQHLIIIKNWASLALGAIDKSSPAREQVEEISDTSLLALEEVREIINDLRPHQIEVIGLTETISSMIQQVESSSAIAFVFESDNVFESDKIDGLLSKEDEVTIYRIIQESVNNIVKHSNAKNASLIVRNEDGAIFVKVSDDGKGFTPESSKSSNSGFGLTGIEERVKMLGGTKTIRSELDRGTEINIRIELQ